MPEAVKRSRADAARGDELARLIVSTRDTRSEDLAGELAQALISELGPRGVDRSSSASRQHYIDTGEYLRYGEAL
jgi:hypothetical protein